MRYIIILSLLAALGCLVCGQNLAATNSVEQVAPKPTIGSTHASSAPDNQAPSAAIPSSTTADNTPQVEHHQHDEKHDHSAHHRAQESSVAPEIPAAAHSTAPTQLASTSTTSTSTTTTTSTSTSTTTEAPATPRESTSSSTTTEPKAAKAPAAELTPSSSTTAASLTAASSSTKAQIQASERHATIRSNKIPTAKRAQSVTVPSDVHYHLEPQRLKVENRNCSTFESKVPKPVSETLRLGNCTHIKLAAYLEVNGQFLSLDNPVLSQNLSSCSLNNLVIDYNNNCARINFMFDSDANVERIKAINGYYFNGSAAQETTFSVVQSLFNTTKGHYYKCNSEQSVNFIEPVVLHLKDFAFEIQRNSTADKFVGEPALCAQDSKPPGSSWVTLAVGVCLLALIAIVLGAYFFGRKRWYQRSTYEPV